MPPFLQADNETSRWSSDWLFSESIELSQLITETIEPKDETGLLAKNGEQKLKERKYLEAKEVFTKVLEQSPNFPLAWFHKGIASAALQDNQEALYCYDMETLHHSDADSKVSSRKGLLLYKMSLWKEANEVFERGLRLNPESPILHLNKGLTLMQLNENKSAIKHFEASIKRDSSVESAHFNKGVCHFKLGQFKQAESCFDRVLGLSVSNLEALNNKARCWLKLFGYREAIACYNRVLVHQPHNVVALTNMGFAQSKLLLFEPALQSYNLALSIDPHHPVAIKNRESLIADYYG